MTFRRTLSQARNKLMRIKFYIYRSSTYLSLINLGMISFLFLSELKTKDYISFDIGQYYFPIITGSLIIFGFIGWFEMKVLKGFAEECRFGQINDPIHANMNRKINKIYEWIEKNGKT